MVRILVENIQNIKRRNNCDDFMTKMYMYCDAEMFSKVSILASQPWPVYLVQDLTYRAT